MNSRLGEDGCQHWVVVSTESHQHGNLTGALVLGGSVFFHRHFSATAQSNEDVGAQNWSRRERMETGGEELPKKQCGNSAGAGGES